MTQVSEHRLADERARRVIREELGQTLFVEAGAGTGKTKALVDRVVALIESGVPVDGIIAITFTEKAAAELRERVRSGLEARLDATTSPAGVESALASLDRAQISTIHSFAQSLLRAYAAEAGIDPDFDVQDAVMTQRRMQERWRSYLESLGGDEAATRAIDRVLSVGLFVNELERLALELASRGELAEALETNAPQPPAVAWPDLAALREEIVGGLGWNTSLDKLRPRVDSLLGLIESLQQRPGERESILASGAGIIGQSWGVGRGDDWSGRCKEMQETAADVAGALRVTLDQLREEALAGVMPYIVRFVRQDERERGRGGTLTFDDLILGVRNLLRRSEAACRSLRNRFDVMLIDEFQDTDPLQVDIAMSFATDPDTGKLEPGRLFLVGDPKQSIYRFRGADMAVYARTRAALEAAGAETPALALNRRSRAPLLDWVNAVFESLIGDGSEPEVQPPYRDIHADRTEDLRGPDVAWIGGQSGDPARVVRVREAEELAALCLQAVHDEQWQVLDREAGVRTAAFRDIAVLIPRRTGLTAIERAFAAAQVPYRVEGGSLIYRTQEVRDLINCLTAVDDPADQVAVVAALRSAAFACSDVDLARFKSAGGRFDYQHRNLDEWAGPVAEGLRALRDYHTSRHDGSIAALVERFVGERGQVETGVLDQGDRNGFRRARFVIEQARSFEAAGPESLRAFISWIENQSGAQILDNEGAGADDDEDAVRILTIHGAKGLEFPIVFLAGLSAAPLPSTPTYSADHTTREVAICIGAKGANRRFTLGPFTRLSRNAERHEDAELARLLYVGATRARDHLVVSLHHKTNRSCAAARLIDAFASHRAEQVAIQRAGGPTVRRRPFEGITIETPDIGGEFGELRRALVEGARKRRYTSATALGYEARAESGDETEPWARGRGGTRVGRAVHAAIQSLPLDADDETVRAFARAQAVAEAVPHRASDVERLVRWVLRESQAWQRALASPRALREVPFALAVDGKVLEGFIDLVIDGADGIEIVDWKTDQVTAEEVPARLEAYRLQAGLYVYGIEEATGRRVSRVTYVFAGAQRELSPGDPASLASAARERLAGATL